MFEVFPARFVARLILAPGLKSDLILLFETLTIRYALLRSFRSQFFLYSNMGFG